MSKPRRLQGLSDIIDAYDTVILDLWGVVHNGYEPFVQTPPTLEALKAAGKSIWLLSNAPRRAEAVAAHLTSMGIVPGLYDHLLTSGEAFWQALHGKLVLPDAKNCYALGDVAGLLQGTGIAVTDDVARADFILASGVPGGTVAANERILERGASRGIPFVCANPDRIVHVGHDLFLCPGALADAYEALGGEVLWYGKPYAGVYASLRMLHPSARILAVGDGLPTDVKGALAAGIDVALVMAGIHKDALFGENAYPSGIGPETPLDDSRLADLIKREGAKPSFIIHGLAW